MTRIKYKLIDQREIDDENLEPNDTNSDRIFLKATFTCAIIMLVVVYNWQFGKIVNFGQLLIEKQSMRSNHQMPLRDIEEGKFKELAESTNQEKSSTQALEPTSWTLPSKILLAKTDSTKMRTTMPPIRQTTSSLIDAHEITHAEELSTTTIWNANATAFVTTSNTSSTTNSITVRTITPPRGRTTSSSTVVPGRTAAADSEIGDKYFVYTSQCHMPKVNPFSADALKIFKKKEYNICNKSRDLITVKFDSQDSSYKLHMNDESIGCCYKTIERSGSGKKADDNYLLLPCSNFHQDFVVPQHVKAIITECQKMNTTKVLQEDAFAFVHPPRNNTPDKSIKLSVLLWGIDSLSRINFQRTMPLTYKYLRDQSWYELQGYNKMGDNTYPNLMALLTGYNSTMAYSLCKPKNVGGLDACHFLWNDYKEEGYATAYAEDWVKFATFNYLKKGFLKPPTDYYLRPFVMAIEKTLMSKKKSGIPDCIGRRHYAEYIYDYAIDFTKIFKSQPSFGLFWTNSFSHNSFSLPSSMDKRTVEYMRTLEKNGIMENSIILFFSDHGMRFGPLRKLKSGFLEERMPNMYIWLPKWFRKQYASFARALELNRNRLTSNYDIYATLQHILKLNTSAADLPRADGCPDCHSIFFEMPENRTCSDAGISEHWCTCNMYEESKTIDAVVKRLTSQLVEATNEYLVARNLTDVCSKLTLHKIVSAETKEQLDANSNFMAYRVQYEANPKKALFEATTRWNRQTERIDIDVNDISRLSKYENDAKCITDKEAKKYCICAK
ncbi:uncharacterized protein LOC115620896 isoform X2 [Scaptodrosophila lebanonensis]|uniref:Uncharacterized protein LOC115620896 isoform X2 n=1 Tax=Drosophila lebanonensis TaxID=7225 RepID=A0A6J2T4N4_DROLE|nr:uncharacterized protein LOC115620896 isoform X2 [Scaptodrosophila lebanonensis]